MPCRHPSTPAWRIDDPHRGGPRPPHRSPGPQPFGGFIEHLGRCIYSGIYDEGAAVADERGFRKDVLALLHELHMGVLRWPGGNFVSNYHWADGIGPRPPGPAVPN